ncbi:hypothetical protein GW17_00044078 [Ensete ventricosum]|nr:hypothetical protein GW17_00044078 [Ensete ventricosum]
MPYRKVCYIIIKESNWMGYIAVSNDAYAKRTGGREIYVAWRGMMRKLESIEGLTINLVPLDQSTRLGGALALLSSFDIVNKGLSKIQGKTEEYFPVCAVLSHVRNDGDWVPTWPFSTDYVDTGSVLDIDANMSPYLKPSVGYHDLQVLLHTVAGWNGKFHLEVKRSPALVNKQGGNLKDECYIPEAWWVEKNKGMESGTRHLDGTATHPALKDPMPACLPTYPK